jgi:hypothetical protein
VGAVEAARPPRDGDHRHGWAGRTPGEDTHRGEGRWELW